MIAGAALGLILAASQVRALNVAYEEGSPYGLGRYLQAVVLVESSACLHKSGDDHKSHGCGQLKVATAQKICRCRISARALESEDGTNLRISAAYLAECFRRFRDPARALLAYNAGIPSASKASARQVRQSRYVKRVEMFVKQLQQIPQTQE